MKKKKLSLRLGWLFIVLVAIVVFFAFLIESVICLFQRAHRILKRKHGVGTVCFYAFFKQKGSGILVLEYRTNPATFYNNIFYIFFTMSRP